MASVALKTAAQVANAIAGGAYDDVFRRLYPTSAPEAARRRWGAVVDAFAARFGGEREVALVSAPGRTEVCGNHTDHQRGRVLAAAVDLDVICVASKNDGKAVRVYSEGYPGVEVDIGGVDGLSPHEGEKGQSHGIARGIAAWYMGKGGRRGAPLGYCGFDACTASAVLNGSGLSSSAAFEVALSNAANALYGAGAGAAEIALSGKFAENNYFGKPSGLMDQMASSVGGFVMIDFEDPQDAKVSPIALNPADYGLSLCVVNSRSDHADLTPQYAAIPEEMRAVAALFGKEVLREVDEAAFYADLPRVRAEAGDRAALRAIHFFMENQLVADAAGALEAKDVARFLGYVNASGRSSFMYLQNIYVPARPESQGLSVALALSEKELSGGAGRWRAARRLARARRRFCGHHPRVRAHGVARALSAGHGRRIRRRRVHPYCYSQRGRHRDLSLSSVSMTA